MTSAGKSNRERQPFWSATKKDFKIDWFSGTGDGGQHRNRHQNCCRITHKASGLVAVGQDHKERTRNQKDAFERLVPKLVEYYRLDKPQHEIEKSDEVIRIYHEPRNEVKDYASGVTDTFKNVIGKPDGSKVIEARRKVKE